MISKGFCICGSNLAIFIILEMETKIYGKHKITQAHEGEREHQGVPGPHFENHSSNCSFTICPAYHLGGKLQKGSNRCCVPTAQSRACTE